MSSSPVKLEGGQLEGGKRARCPNGSRASKSGKYCVKNEFASPKRHISKRGRRSLRRAGYERKLKRRSSGKAYSDAYLRRLIPGTGRDRFKEGEGMLEGPLRPDMSFGGGEKQ
jgi:hypothetical protein